MNNNKEIPVILIHKGMQEYLELTIKQALKTNKVYLIGDTEPTNITNNVDNFTFYNINNYLKDCDLFTNHYEHLSTNDHNYELFCFHRWFILRNFMIEQNLKTVFYIDSDVMLFVDVNDEFHKFEQYDFTLLHRTAAISSFFTFTGLNNFCDFLLNTYRDKKGYNFQKIASHYYVRQKHHLPGGVSDMTLFDFFHYWDEHGNPGRVGEMMQIINDSTYDHNINVPDQYFEFQNGTKKINFKNGIPYVYSNKLKKDIKFNSLHFQGSAKRLIKMVYDGCNN